MIDRAIQLAWAAGFADGEGFIGITRSWDERKFKRYSYRIQFDVCQAHEAPIRYFASIFPGVGKVSFRTNAKKGCWHYRVMGQTALPVIRELLPYLHAKAKQAQLVLEFETTVRGRGSSGKWRPVPADVQSRRAAIWAACVELNGGRALRAERLSEEAPTGNAEGDAIVRPHGNNNRESAAEMPAPKLRVV